MELRFTSLSGCQPFRQQVAWRLMVVTLLALTVPAQGQESGGPDRLEPTAGSWKTWLLSSADELRPPAPPSRNSPAGRAEMGELIEVLEQRTAAGNSIVQFWDGQGGIPVWSQILLDKIKETGTNPVRAARAFALFHTAIADATIAVWDAKFAYDRPQPAATYPWARGLSKTDPRLPSYPSEHAAIAAAATTVLEYLFPGQTAPLRGARARFGQAANEAAYSRLWAGASYRSDLEAGFQIGRAVGQRAVARGQSDNSDATWDATTQPGRLIGPQYWVPTPPAYIPVPLEPMAGTWKTWVMTSGSQFRPPAPAALETPFPSPRFLAEVAEVKRTVDNLTPDQLRIANFWADNPGESYTPPGHWMEIATEQAVENKLSTPRAVRALALVSVGLADAAIACWDAKFTYWVLRPVTAIRTLAGQPFHDPNFLSPVVTPPFPAYTSGHATFSGAAASVLEYLFPGGKAVDALGKRIGFQEAAEQAAMSRLYGGIHYRSDNDEGLICGRKVAGAVISRAQNDGAP